MKTAKEYWKDFPKHNPPKDADITEAMNEFASLRVEEETKQLTETNRQLVEALENLALAAKHQVSPVIMQTRLNTAFKLLSQFNKEEKV